MNKNILALLGILLVVNYLPGNAQVARTVQPDQRFLQSRYQMAQQLERSGQLEQAAELYQSVFDAQPENSMYYTGYVRLLFSKKDLTELERVIALHLSKNPRSEIAVVDRGRLLYLKGDTLAAFQTWQQALASFNYSGLIYRTLFNCYVGLNLDRAGEELINDARQRHHQPDLFALELANFHALRGEIVAATEEYLLFGRYNQGNYGMIGAQILRLESSPSHWRQLDSLLRAEIERAPKVVDLHRLRSEFLFKIKAFPEAFEESLIIEKLTGERGSTLLSLLQDLVAVQAYSVAESLTTNLLTQAKWQNIAPQLLLQLADLAEKQYLAPKIYSPMNYFYPDNLFFNTPYIQRVPSNLAGLQRAFQIYDSLAYKFARSEYTPQALYRLAELRFAVVRDFDGAWQLYQLVEKQSRELALRLKARQRLGELLLAKGSPAEAREYFLQAAERAEGTDFEKIARINAALSTFLTGKIDTAYQMVSDLLGLLTPDAAEFNDVFEFEGFLRLNYATGEKIDQQAMQTFARAELLLRQNKLSEAAQYYHLILKEYDSAHCSSAARFRLMQIALLFDDIQTADSLAYQMIAKRSELSAQAIFMLGETADYFQSNLPRAASWYELLLEKYPDFLQIAAVRKRLREIYRLIEPAKES